MPRYYFHVRDGLDLPDNEGTDLPDQRTAQREAIRLAAQLLADRADEFWGVGDWWVEVADSAGLVLFVVHFSGAYTAAGQPNASNPT